MRRAQKRCPAAAGHLTYQRQAGLWRVPVRLHACTQKISYHRQGIRTQARALHAGVGLAHLFNRAIVLPKIACYCER